MSSDLRTMLAQLADGQRTVGIDLDRLIADGRHRVRRRNFLSGLTGIAVLGPVGGVVAAMALQSVGDAPQPTGQPTPSESSLPPKPSSGKVKNVSTAGSQALAAQLAYALEKFLNGLFAMFDIDAKAPFRITGEQIDGAFTFEGEYLLEARWQDAPTPVADLDSFGGKVGRKLDSTLGLFVSMNGFQGSAIKIHWQGRSTMILMDGSDLNAILDDRIALPHCYGESASTRPVLAKCS